MFKNHHPSFRHIHHRPRYLNRLWNFLTSSTMAFMLAVSAIVIGYYQFYLSRPILKYTSFTTQITSSSSPTGLNFHINGISYKNLYKSVVTLTNAGEQALSGSDVSPLGHDPIRIPIPKKVKIFAFIVVFCFVKILLLFGIISLNRSGQCACYLRFLV